MESKCSLHDDRTLNLGLRHHSLFFFVIQSQAFSKAKLCEVQIVFLTKKYRDRLLPIPIFLVQMTGLEPAWYCYHKNLNLTCLPIPPHLHIRLPRKIQLSSVVTTGVFSVVTGAVVASTSFEKTTEEAHSAISSFCSSYESEGHTNEIIQNASSVL